MFKKEKNNQKGFTLIELLVVITIIGILAGILFIAINPKEQSDKAKAAKIANDLKQIQKTFEWPCYTKTKKLDFCQFFFIIIFLWKRKTI